MKRMQSGFTLVELIVVIVILGILAATALPRFINMSSDARVAALQGMTGAVRSAVAMTQSKYLAAGNNTATNVSFTPPGGSSTSVTVAAGSGIPDAGALPSLLQSTDGFDLSECVAKATTCNIYSGTKTGFPNCFITYTTADGSVSTTNATSANCGG